MKVDKMRMKSRRTERRRERRRKRAGRSVEEQWKMGLDRLLASLEKR